MNATGALRRALRQALDVFRPTAERRADWAERAAIIEFDGEVDLPDAERRATIETGFDPARQNSVE